MLQIETFLQDEGHKQQREPEVATLKDDELFVLDKVTPAVTVCGVCSHQMRIFFLEQQHQQLEQQHQ
jgi:bacterioferritin-associated ferredoxin